MKRYVESLDLVFRGQAKVPPIPLTEGSVLGSVHVPSTVLREAGCCCV